MNTDLATRFAAALREYGGISAACAAIGASRAQAYQRPDLRAEVRRWQVERVPVAPPPVAPTLEALRADVVRIETNAQAATGDVAAYLNDLSQAARLRLALREHGAVEPACRAIGMSRQAVNKRPDLRIVVEAWRPPPAERAQTILLLPPDVVTRLDAAAAAGLSRSAMARSRLEAALRGELPAPDHRTGVKVKLDLGATKAALAARLGTTDAHAIAGVVRAILAG